VLTLKATSPTMIPNAKNMHAMMSHRKPQTKNKMIDEALALDSRT
jgi:hypothetical protein